MQSQKLNEKEERDYEVNQDYSKARNFPTSVIGRRRLRMLRRILFDLGIPFPIPMNSAAITDEYCTKYGKKEEDFRSGLF